MCLVDGAALLVLFSLALEAAVRRSSGKTEDRLLEGILNSPAEAKSQPVLLAEIVVDLRIERRVVFCELGILLVVVAEYISAVGVRYQSKNLERDGVHQCDWNDVVALGGRACRIKRVHRSIAPLDRGQAWRVGGENLHATGAVRI